MSLTVNIENRRAYFEYEILQKFSAGMMLTGTEIKSIKAGKANINEAYCVFQKDELFIKNMHISEYTLGTHYNHDPLRLRKLLMNKKELEKLHAKVKERGQTIIPLKIYLSERGFAKLDIALAKGKKTHDKRESIKAKDTKRDLQRVIRGRY
ncbi:MAG: SsrA-binding protein SmpB [Chitinophagales bacterium]|nr:SsrA-binding protein SmpB [Chitinophagales bacterium]